MRYLALICAAALAACTAKPSFQDASLTDRDLDLETFFEGNLRAYGQFQDILGTVRRQFAVDITGIWDGQTLRLTEDFVYEDGSTEQRIWTLAKTGPVQADQTWRGTAPGIIGVATGREQGDRFNWRYTIDLPVGDGKTTRVTFDDWMWLQSGDRLLNRAYMKRYGLDVGDVIITFEKL